MKAYQVQFCLPVENPEDNITMERRGQVVHFLVPCNLPDLGEIGYAKLSELAKDTTIAALSPSHNKKKTPIKE